MEQFANYIMQEIGHKLPAGTTLLDISQYSYRYSMYKVGPVLSISVSHTSTRHILRQSPTGLLSLDLLVSRRLCRKDSISGGASRLIIEKRARERIKCMDKSAVVSRSFKLPRVCPSRAVVIGVRTTECLRPRVDLSSRAGRYRMSLPRLFVVVDYMYRVLRGKLLFHHLRRSPSFMPRDSIGQDVASRCRFLSRAEIENARLEKAARLASLRRDRQPLRGSPDVRATSLSLSLPLSSRSPRR